MKILWYLEETLSDRVYKVYDSEVEPCFNSSEGWGSSEQRVDMGVWWKDMGGGGERKVSDGRVCSSTTTTTAKWEQSGKYLC